MPDRYGDFVPLELGAENERLKARLAEAEAIINDLYPAIAGLVVAAAERGESVARGQWNEYCEKMLKFMERGEK